MYMRVIHCVYHSPAFSPTTQMKKKGDSFTHLYPTNTPGGEKTVKKSV